MCGVLGYISRNSISQTKFLELITATNKVSHRGPDGGGFSLINSKNGDTITKFFYNGNDVSVSGIDLDTRKFDIFLGHRRLSIFDLSENGFQPMTSGNDIICFNGEVYNYLELKKQFNLEELESDADTEVALKLYQKIQKSALSHFNGMWSMMIWDHNKKELVVSNDRFGVKPLYYLQNSDELYFFSEVKQINAFPKIRLSLDYSTINQYLSKGLLDIDVNTFYNEVKRFEPGHYSVISPLNLGDLEFVSYYSLPEQEKIELEDAKEELITLIEDSVKIRTRADVDWGVAVSGGLDSSIIYSKVAKLAGNQEATTFSAIFPGMEGDESEHIYNLIDKNNSSTKFIFPDKEFGTSDLENHIYHQDFPIATTSFYAEWCVSRKVRDSGVKVILNGQGADEVFGGYHLHFYNYVKSLVVRGHIYEFLDQVNSFAELKKVSRLSIMRIVFGDVKLWMKFKFQIGKPNAELSRYFVKDLYQALKNDIYKYQLPTNLRSDDRDGMAFGVESRHPFMDYRIVDFGMRLPDKYKIKNGWQKWILREISDQIPDSIRYRKDKKGYTTPQKDMLEIHRNYINEKRNSAFSLIQKNYDTDRMAFLGIWLEKFQN